MNSATVRGWAERLLQFALSLDEESLSRLAPLQQRSIHLYVTDLGIAWRLLPMDRHVHIAAIQETDHADLEVTARSDALLAVLSDEASLVDRLQVKGDVELLKHLDELVRGCRPDVEDRLAAVLGDVAARQLCRYGRASGTLTVRVARKFIEDLGEYLHEHELATRIEETEAFIDAVDQLRDRIERLAARIRQLDA